MAGSSGKSLHLGMRRHIGEPLREVMSAADDPVVANNDGTYRDFVEIKSFPGLFQGFPHEIFIGKHYLKLNNNDESDLFFCL
jgi:hypothetical protein